jgi:hypothetical protein
VLLAAACTPRPAPARARAPEQTGTAQEEAAPEILDLDAYNNLACAIRADRRVWCWGYGRFGLASRGSGAHAPVRIERFPAATRVFVGPAGVCATGREGGLYCLGKRWLMGIEEPKLDYAGAADASERFALRQKGIEEHGPDYFAVFESDPGPLSDAARILEGAPEAMVITETFACALVGGAVWCWGAPEGGPAWWLGTKTTPVSPGAGDESEEASLIRPRHVAGVPALTSIHTNDRIICGLDGAIHLWCWGDAPGMGFYDKGPNATVGPLEMESLTPGSEITARPYDAFFIAQGGVIREFSPRREKDQQYEFGQPATSVRAFGEASKRRFYAIDRVGWVIYVDGDATRPLAVPRGVVRLVGGGKAALACALTRESRVFCWDSQDAPESEAPYPGDISVIDARQFLGWIRFPPLVDTPVKESAAGPALVPRAQIEANDSSIRALSVGRDEACALRKNGRAYCWLLGREVAPVLLPADALVDVAVDAGKTCGVTADGGVSCWTQHLRDVAKHDPWQPLPLRDAARIATTDAGFCVLHTSGRVSCISRRRERRDGGLTDVSVVKPIPGISDAVGLEDLPGGFCAVRRQGGLTCWHADYGLLTFRTPAPVRGLSHPPDQPRHTITAIAEDGRLWRAALHDEALTPEDESRPWEPSGGDNYSHQCELASDGPLVCWGMNGYGQLGRGSVSMEEPTPAPLAGVPPLRLFELNGFGGCGSDGTGVWCWGEATYGGLRETTPTRVLLDVPIASFDFNTSNGVVVDASGDVWAWGASNHALGFAYAHATPVRIPVGEPMKHMELSNLHCSMRRPSGEQPTELRCSTKPGGLPHCGITRTQRVVCWYADSYYTPPAQAPVPMPGKATALAVSETNACAIASGRLFCWRMGGDPPVEIPELRQARAVTVVEGLGCALSREGRVGCWRMLEPRRRGEQDPLDVPLVSDVHWLDGIGGIDHIEFLGATLHVRQRDRLAKIQFSDTRPCIGYPCKKDDRLTTRRVTLCKAPSSSINLPTCRDANPLSTLEVEGWTTAPVATHPAGLAGCHRTGKATFTCTDTGEVVFPAPIKAAMGRGEASWCAHATDGHLYCVGLGHAGQLGSGRGGLRPTPVPVALP